MLRTGSIALAALLGVTLARTEARACSPCSTGDPTLTVTGVEKPYEGRLRLGAQMLHRTASSGIEGVDRIDSAEQRLELSAAWAATDWLFVSTKLPLVRRRATYPNLANDDVLSLGDFELRGKVFVYQDRSLDARHLVALTGGVGLPTGAIVRGPDGQPLPFEAQPGTASINALAGVSYAYFARPFSLYASANAALPVVHRTATEVGAFGLFTVAGQYQPWEVAAFRVAIDTRVERSLRRAGIVDPHSGGVAVFASPEIVLSPVDDLLVRALVQLPLFRRLDGEASDGVSLLLGVAHDF